jgi:hypothetical protein
MTRLLIAWLAMNCFWCWVADTARPAVVIAPTINPAPHPALVSVRLNAVGTAGEVIRSFEDLSFTRVYNVQPGFGRPSTHLGTWTGPNGDSSAAWGSMIRTCCLT